MVNSSVPSPAERHHETRPLPEAGPGPSQEVVRALNERLQGKRSEISAVLLHEELRRVLWQAQEGGMKRLRRLHAESAESVFGKENLLQAFAPLQTGDTVYVGCPDDRCGTDIEGEDMHRFCLPGSGVLNPIDEADELGMQQLFIYLDRGINVIPTYHDNCGACAAKAAALGVSDTTAIGKKVANDLAQWMGVNREPVRMGYDDGSAEVQRLKEQNLFIPMRGYPDFHDGRKLVVDLSNRLYRGSFLGIKPVMKLNWYDDRPGQLNADIKLLLDIMMDPHHAPGLEAFNQDPYQIVIVGEPARTNHPELETEAFQRHVRAMIDATPYKNAVDIVGFNAPSARECEAYQKAKS